VADLGTEGSFRELLRSEKPESVIHAGALTQVDYCELNQEECFQVNALGTSYVLGAAEEQAGHLIYISTDFVFDGMRGGYLEDDATGPVNWYGTTKLQGEEYVRKSRIPWTIVRTCLVYGNNPGTTRTNIITWTKSKLENGEKIQVVNDQIRTPTFAGDLAMGILAVLERRAEGIFHISGKDILTPYQMALQTAHHFGLRDELIEPVNEKNFSQPARRPLRTGFVIDRARGVLGYDPLPFKEGISRMYESSND
jgi:dTDP-4-dehydrorhamnose reductase